MEIQTTEAAGTGPVVRLSGAGKRYRDRPALSGADLVVSGGELVFVVGPSGAGKSTLLRLVNGEVRPTEGEIWVDGLPVHRLGPRRMPELRHRIGMVFQDFKLLPDQTARENVAYAAQVADLGVTEPEATERALQMLELVGLRGREDAFPSELSGGEQQRVAIARAMVCGPRVLLADEPTGNLDGTTALGIMALLQRVAELGSAVIVVTHNEEVVRRLGGRVVVLEDGRLIAEHHRAPATATLPSAATVPAEAPRASGHPRRDRRLVLRNAARFLFDGALRGWTRNFSSTSPAIASLTLLLLLTGAVALSGLALRGVVAQQAQSAAVLHVYLRDDAERPPVSALHRTLMRDPEVASVGYTSKAQALREAGQRPGLGSMAGESGSNPFPASFDVQVKQLQNVGVVARLAERSPAVDPSMPTSYDAGAYQTVVTGLSWFAIAGAVFLFLLGIGTIALTQNSIKAAIFSRRAEVRVMQLVGARRWMVRGPFVVEGAMTGGIAGLAAGLVTLVAGVSVVAAGRSSFAQIAPGVDIRVCFLAAALVLVAGLVLGSAASLYSVHRQLEA